MRDWDKYIHKNKIGADCQLVTAVNAYYHLTGNTVSEEGYSKFIKLAKCEHGSAISIEEVWKELKINPTTHFFSIMDIEKNVFREGKPVEVRTNTKHYGFHSSLIIDYEEKSDAYRVLNLNRMTSQKGWIFFEDLFYAESIKNQNRVCSNCETGTDEVRWSCRVFELV
jgi:hypothetical protein